MLRNLTSFFIFPINYHYLCRKQTKLTENDSSAFDIGDAIDFYIEPQFWAGCGVQG